MYPYGNPYPAGYGQPYPPQYGYPAPAAPVQETTVVRPVYTPFGMTETVTTTETFGMPQPMYPPRPVQETVIVEGGGRTEVIETVAPQPYGQPYGAPQPYGPPQPYGQPYGAPQPYGYPPQQTVIIEENRRFW